MWVKFSNSEKKVEDFAYEKFLGLNEEGDKLFWHSLEVARLLYQYGYRGKYVFTALCQYLPEHTGTSEAELKENCGRITAEAVRVLSQKNLRKKEYADLIRKNEVACLVKVADLMVHMKKVMLGEYGSASPLAREIDKYYRGFADRTKCKDEFDDLFYKLKLCVILDKTPDLDQMPPPEGWGEDNGYDRFEIVIKRARLVAGLSQDACDIYINGQRFIDMIKEDEIKRGWEKSICGNYIGRPPEHVLLPDCTVFTDSKSDQLRDVDDGRSYTLACSHCGESECSTVRARITVDEKTVTWSEIGVKEPGEVGPFTFRRDQYESALDYGNAAYLSAYCLANGIRGLKKNRTRMMVMLRQAILYGNKQAVGLLPNGKSHDEKREKTLYWIDDRETYFSALKATFTPDRITMTHYNNAYPEGREVDSVHYYKIASGMNMDYDCVGEEEFDEFILKTRRGKNDEGD
jgi:hypothetical protein